MYTFKFSGSVFQLLVIQVGCSFSRSGTCGIDPSFLGGYSIDQSSNLSTGSMLGVDGQGHVKRLFLSVWDFYNLNGTM